MNETPYSKREELKRRNFFIKKFIDLGVSREHAEGMVSCVSAASLWKSYEDLLLKEANEEAAREEDCPI